jgi:hypothetical protein
MGSRARHALIPLALAAFAQGLAAQNPPSAPQQDSTARDTATAHLIYSDVFAGETSIAPRLVLNRGVVYRIEVEPGTAVLDIRSARRPSLPPLFLVPLSREALGGQSAAYLIVPRSTEEYRIDITASGDEPVRLRIWRDPRESARLARIHAEGFRLPILAIALRAMVIAPFRDARSSPVNSLYSLNTAPQGALGMKACLAIVPNGRIVPDRTGGCALTFGLWYRGTGGSFYTLGIEPEFVVSRRATADLSLTPQLAFGDSHGGGFTSQYVFTGLGARYTTVLPWNQRLGLQFEATVLDVQSMPATPDPGRANSLTLSVGAGFIMRL